MPCLGAEEVNVWLTREGLVHSVFQFLGLLFPALVLRTRPSVECGAVVFNLFYSARQRSRLQKAPKHVCNRLQHD